MLHAHVQSFLQMLALMSLLLDFLVFYLPKSMFKFINAEITPRS